MAGRNGCVECGQEAPVPYWLNANGQRVYLDVVDGQTFIPGANPSAVLCPPLEFRCTADPVTNQFTVVIFNPLTGGSVALGSAF